MVNMNKDEFYEALKDLNIELNEHQKEQLEQFYEILIEENKKINLTRITEKKDVYLKHFYDSLTISKVIDLTKIKTLCDVGTGAGFPGIVLKIFYPNLKIDYSYAMPSSSISKMSVEPPGMPGCESLP